MPFLQLHPDLPKFGFGADYVPPAVENAALPVVTTPKVAGQSVGLLPEPCFYPQPELHGRTIFCGTAERSPLSCFQRAFLDSWHEDLHGNLDAGDFPSGGVMAVQISGNYVARTSTVYRL